MAKVEANFIRPPSLYGIPDATLSLILERVARRNSGVTTAGDFLCVTLMSARGVAAWSTFGEPAGIRTQDPMIKSHVLYQLSYGLGAPS